MANLCREAAMGPIRSLTIEAIQHIACDEVSETLNLKSQYLVLKITFVYQ